MIYYLLPVKGEEHVRNLLGFNFFKHIQYGLVYLAKDYIEGRRALTQVTKKVIIRIGMVS